ncbi:lipopolysaccharide biosynthesis protein [Umezawaea sp. Da 62-37]|uniref:lipopolysaccharide biosynthesis protein n=1 Tax=Umezawaea sp. Da 62-37 TaxID=3075927 RepID=UPI0028F739E7|nr:lipopolysaccharide biosynthesis protein [Umezawaea sp. Da 62-37]WNV89189.1 lipopolysaccharide biosynthesis protein [Umezawaea sp. Da 62-37]
MSTESTEELGTLVRKGMRWSFASTFLSRLANLASGIILARLLTPNDYGLFAVATVSLVILININDLGLEQVLVRWPGDVAKVASTATTVIFGFSVVLFIGFQAGASAFASALGAPEATDLVRVLAFAILINGALAVPSAMLTRSFRQDLRTYADLTGFIVTTGLTLALAMTGFGVWGLVWGRLLGNLVNGLLHLKFTPVRYRPGWDPAVARELLRGGLPLAGATILAVAMVNVDNVVIGRLLGPETLGLYVLAFNLSSWPVTLLSIPVARVSVPAFARLQEDLVALRAAFARSMGLLMAAAVPICGLLAIMAGPTIRFVYGDKWAGAATALVFLAVLGLARVALQLCFDVLIAVGRARQTLGLQALWLVVLTPALAIGAHLHGVAGVGVAHMAVAVVVMLPAFLFALTGLGIRPGLLGSAVLRPALGAVLLCVVPYFATRELRPDLLVLLVGGVGGLALYLPVVLPMRRGLAALKTAKPAGREAETEAV